MQNKEKMIICSNYDSILNKCPKIRFMGRTELISPGRPILNNIFSEQHIDVLNAFASKVANELGFSVSINEIIQFMDNPNFDVQTFYPMSLFNGRMTGIQQSLVIGEAEEQVIIEKKQRIKALKKIVRTPLIPITHVSRIRFGKELFYFNEEIIFLSENQYNQLVYWVKNDLSVKNCVPIDHVLEDQIFKIALWNVLEERGDKKYHSVPNTFYSTQAIFDHLFMKHHDIPLKDEEWMNSEFVYYDNRACYPETTKEISLLKQFKK